MDDGSVMGDLFQGLKFWLAYRVPLRSVFIEQIKNNGGLITAIETVADIRIADHAKPQLANDALSYTFLEECIAAGALVGQDAHRITGQNVPSDRPAGSALPAKATRNSYTLEDDRFLYQFVKMAEQSGRSASGNVIYQDLAKQNDRHPWQSWRDRYVRRLVRMPPDMDVEQDLSTVQSADTPIPVVEIPKTPPPEKSVEAPASDAEHNDHLKSNVPVFTPQDKEFLLSKSPAIQRMNVTNYLDYWKDFAMLQPKHTASEWKLFYEESVFPEFRASGLEDGDVSVNTSTSIADGNPSHEKPLPIKEMPRVMINPSKSDALSDGSNRSILGKRKLAEVEKTVKAPQTPRDSLSNALTSSLQRGGHKVAASDTPGITPPSKQGTVVLIQTKSPGRIPTIFREEISRPPGSPSPLSAGRNSLFIPDGDSSDSDYHTQGQTFKTRSTQNASMSQSRLQPSNHATRTTEANTSTKRIRERDPESTNIVEIYEVEEISGDDKENPVRDRSTSRRRPSLTERDGVLPAFGKDLIDFRLAEPVESWEDSQDGRSTPEKQENIDAGHPTEHSNQAISSSDNDNDDDDDDEDVEGNGEGENEGLEEEDEDNDAFEPIRKPIKSETQAILEADTQEPDFFMPLPPESSNSSSLFPPNTTSRSPVVIIPPADAYSPSPRTRESPSYLAETQPTASEEDIDAFIAQYCALGHTEHDVITALRRTTLNSQLAVLVLDEMRRHGHMAVPNIEGVWTDEDDDILRSGDAVMMSLVEERHGPERFGERIEALRAWGLL